MKKLLILAGASTHVKVVEQAKQLGIYTIVTDYLDVLDSPGKQVADEYWDIDINDVKALVEACRKHHVDGVLNYCIDPAQLPYQNLCEKLALPCYGTREQFSIMTDKVKFREFASHHGLKIIPSYTLEEAMQQKDIFPVLVKPAESRGSRGQRVCYRAEELPEAVALASAESQNGKYLIEKYMDDGQDMSLAYLVIKGVPYLMKCGDRYVGLPEDGMDRQQAVTVLPSHLLGNYRKTGEPLVKKFIQALGIQWGPVFLQAFWCKGELYVYDPGLRFPGSDFDLAMIKETGFNPLKAMIDFALTGEMTGSYGNPEMASCYKDKMCLILSVISRPGVIAKIAGLKKLRQDERILSIDERCKCGDVIPKSGDIQQRIFELLVYLPQAELREFCDELYRVLQVLDGNDENMIIDRIGREIMLLEGVATDV
ncbi:Biotin carboxylase [Selenomonas sp. WCT3]|uniref:ATP-grasp domain-containing protein n=1 Tax=Selenomonas sp. WCT3 TaxID=3158785 RepID=UPI00088B244E|nr:Biotin carboxylase [Selenomonas ruminantium]